ncbi:tRNA adenosine(34) deaminase TadA [Fundicoccus culcitae]|uniref:tRNA-specific adenosine deaminase n=1 Tax=Fundicoccus culcitae TaxID=2969821 RepID=A0ABY5P3P9_9LACT|nr:tRNA adenosine(34) deaminase TadA [Fundicoccus culcitae]UUX33125.1 tRNA adenosine(34) deaminase TadA [Fundicoccus culcitae]
MHEEDEFWMRQALEEAAKAGAIGEVPIGAVIVKDNQLIATGHNLREINHAALAHAEMVAIQAANEALGAWRLEGATLYVTLEPCPMCAGAMIMSRVSRVVYGASDPKAGCAGSLMNLLEDERFNHQPELVAGVLADESSQMLKNFFKTLRDRKKNKANG